MPNPRICQSTIHCHRKLRFVLECTSSVLLYQIGCSRRKVLVVSWYQTNCGSIVVVSLYETGCSSVYLCHTSYTLWAIKMCHFVLNHSCYVLWYIFAPLVPKETGMFALQRSFKIYNCTLTVSSHYLMKLLKKHKTSYFEVSCHRIWLLIYKNKSMS